MSTHQERMSAEVEETASRLRAGAPEDELTFNSEHRLRAENLAFDIDVWYRQLQQHTFESVFLPLTRFEATAIVHHYDVAWRGRSSALLTSDDVSVLRALEKRIDEALAKPPFTTSDGGARGAFLRLCGRSPKDGEPLDREDVWRRYQGNLERAIGEERERIEALKDCSTPQELDDWEGNTRLIAVGRTPTLRVDSGAAALSLVLSSERIFLDMVDWLKYGEPEQIVLRTWEPELCMEYEFRVFIFEGQVRAISQYDHYCVYSRLHDRREAIQAAILECWELVHACVGVHSYCADFVFVESTGQARLIEISPFLPCTGPALFHWVRDADVLHGRAPFEFRLNQKPSSHINDLVKATWEDRWRPSELQQVPPFYSHWEGKDSGASEASGGQEEENEGSIGLLKRAFIAVKRSIAAPSGEGDDTVTHEEIRDQRIFVYGTLKRGFHWHEKFLGQAEFVGAAVTRDAFPLVVGDCGVPYLLGDMAAGYGEPIGGEVWAVASETLKGMDEYEGCGKGYYDRRRVDIQLEGGEISGAWLYLLSSSTEELRKRPTMREYSKEIHDLEYRPIQHILVKQQQYLGHKVSTWGLAKEAPAFNDAKS